MNPIFQIVNQMLFTFSGFVNANSFEQLKIVVLSLMTRNCSDASTVQLWRWMFPDCHWTDIPRTIRESAWNPWKISMALFKLVREQFPGDGNIYIVADTTDVERYTKSLPCVHKLWSAKLGRYIFGQCWFVLGVLVQNSTGYSCLGFLPILWDKNMKRTDLLKMYLESLDIKNKMKYLIADSYFSSVRASGWHTITRLKSNSALYFQPPVEKKRRGAPRKRGEKVFLSKYFKMTSGWTAYQYRGRDIEYITMDLVVRQWDNQIARIVICRFKKAKSKDKAMIIACSDLEMSAEKIIDLYAGRFEIEVMFQEVKMNMGFGKYRGSKKDGHDKMATLIFVAQSLMQILRLKFNFSTEELNMPWYKPKQTTPNLLRKLLGSSLLTKNIFELVEKDINSKKIVESKKKISLHITNRM